MFYQDPSFKIFKVSNKDSLRRMRNSFSEVNQQPRPFCPTDYFTLGSRRNLCRKCRTSRVRTFLRGYFGHERDGCSLFLFHAPSGDVREFMYHSSIRPCVPTADRRRKKNANKQQTNQSPKISWTTKREKSNLIFLLIFSPRRQIETTTFPANYHRITATTRTRTTTASVSKCQTDQDGNKQRQKQRKRNEGTSK